jgi:hypothetical protein
MCARLGQRKIHRGDVKRTDMTEADKESPRAADVADVSDKLADKPKLPRRNLSPAVVTAAATGIGSAALLAALLYANRSRKKKPDPE